MFLSCSKTKDKKHDCNGEVNGRPFSKNAHNQEDKSNRKERVSGPDELLYRLLL